MHPRYGVPDVHHHHHQQQNQQYFMENDCGCPSVFPISHHQNPNFPCQTLPQHHFQQQQKQKQPQQQIFLELQQQQQQQIQQQHSIPITYQLFHHHHQQQEFPPFQQQILQQQQHPTFLTVNFKLGLNENSGNDKECALNQQQQEEEATTLLHAHEHNPPHALLLPHCWHPPEDSSTIKQPVWKVLNRCNGNEQDSENVDQEVQRNKNKYYKPLHMQQVDESSERSKSLENKDGIFGELEAVYSLCKAGETNQTGSGSALTGENSPTNIGLSMLFGAINGQNVGSIRAANTAIGVDHVSENSIGEEASLRKRQKRKRNRKMKEKLSSLAGFFEGLVKQVMEQQDFLHRKFLEVIERMDRERTEKEEDWRRQEADKYNKDAIARAHEQALASTREAHIVSYIEKITGQSISIPARKTPLLLQPEFPREPIEELTPVKRDNHSRWPKAEVEALIQVRSSVEKKFEEPGLKGPLWEEVSSSMGSMGYQRSAKRCKEKWENINKYFRKTKETTNKRCRQSKTCSYFSQLDQLYSRTLVNSPPSNTTSMSVSSIEVGVKKQGYSGVLEAFIVGGDLATATKGSSESARIAEICPSRMEIDDKVEIEQGRHDQGKENCEDVGDKDGGEQDDGDGGEKIGNSS